MGKQVIITEGRLSFSALGEPEQYQGKGPFRWAATFLINPTNATKAAIDKAIEEVAEEKWAKKAKTYLPEILLDKKGCFWIDGDRKDYDGYAGNWAATAYRYEKDGRPFVLDNDTSPLYKPDGTFYEGKAGRLFDGCFVRGQIEIWAQDNDSGRGIRATLLQVQRLRKGDAFGGGSQPVAGVFDAIEDDEDDEELG